MTDRTLGAKRASSGSRLTCSRSTWAKQRFVLPYDRWIRSGLSGEIERTLRDPVALRPVGLDPDAVNRLWRAFRDGAAGLYWSRVWAIYVRARWCHRHGVYR